VTLHSDSDTNHFSGFFFTFNYNQIRKKRIGTFETEFVAIDSFHHITVHFLTSQVTFTS
jgi:hypothetical protein